MDRPDRRQWLLRNGLMMGFVALLFVPHWGRLTHPSLYGDDLIRLADLRNMPLGSVLFRPFNEHMAPAFELWTWAVWEGVGGRLRWASLALTVASAVPFTLLLRAVGVWLRRELQSRTAALVGVAVLGLTPLPLECVSWFSASSFSWAVLGIVAGLILAGGGGSIQVQAAGLAVVTLLAPWFSAIGVLAAPLASLRVLIDRTTRGRDRLVLAVGPCVGLAVVLAVAAARRHDRVIGAGVQQPGRHAEGIMLALAAPLARLVPVSLMGMELDRWLPIAALAGMSMIAALTLLWRGRREPVVVVALAMIAAGYLLTYPFRNIHTARWLLADERFHLLPLFGLAALVAWLARRWLARFDVDPARPWGVAVGVGLLLLVLHAGRFERLDAIYRHAEQPATLAAIDHLATFPAPRAQMLRALDPVWSAWFQREFNGLWLLPPNVRPETEDDATVRRDALAFLSGPERRDLWGGMNVTPLAHPTESDQGVAGSCIAIRHAQIVRETPVGTIYRMTGWPADLVFRYDDKPRPKSLVLTCDATRTPIEIAWRADDQGWSVGRSVRFQPDRPGAWRFDLDRWPHWDGSVPGGVPEIRVRFMSTPLTIGPPRLVVP